MELFRKIMEIIGGIFAVIAGAALLFVIAMICIHLAREVL